MTLDLSAITDALLHSVSTRWTTAPIWAQNGTPPAPQPNFTGLAPDAARTQAGPQLSLYLYHVESNSAAESLFWQSQMLGDTNGSPARFLPLALDAYYLLSAFSESYIDEQQAMSVAMRVFHDQPVLRSPHGATAPWELTLTLEHRSYDELSRLWQATTAPLRMSLVYRAAIVLVDPDQMPPGAPTPSTVTIATGELDPAAGTSPALTGTARQVRYTAPGSQTVAYQQSPATVAPGQQLVLLGSGLDAGSADTVFLLDAGGTETDVSAWAVPGTATASRRALQLPGTVGAAPAASPTPGVYQVRVGHGPLGAAGSYRSNATPVGIAAAVSAAGGPVLSGAAPFTVQGAGFAAGPIEVLVGATALAPVTGAPAPGQVTVSPSGTSLTFDPPAGVAGTIAPVRILVAGIESQPALWVTL